MNNNVQSLPGIKSIGYVEAEKLSPNVMLKGICNCPVGVFTDVVNIPLCGTPTCTVEDEYDRHGRLQSVKLLFKSTQFVPTHRRIAFVVTDVKGQSFLIGAKEPPHPTVDLTINFGAPDGDAAASSYEVKYVAVKALLLCSVAAE